MEQIIIYLFLVSSFHKSENYRILGTFPVAGKSHMAMLESLMKGLADKGHEVDVMSHFPLKKHIPRYNDISILGTLPVYTNNISIPLIQTKLGSPYKTAKFFLKESGSDTCKAVFTSDVGKELKNSDNKYDLVIIHLVGTDCMLGFAHHFKVPVVAIITSVGLPWSNDRVGNPDNPSYIPNYFLGFVNPLNLIERLTNAAYLLITKLMHKSVNKIENSSVRKFFGSDVPNIEDLAYDTSLVLVNGDFSINTVRPNVPNFVYVGGLHIKPPKPLPQNLENSIAITSEYKGLIYLSMGSMVVTESLPPNKLRALFEAFNELSYKILWKGIRENIPKDMDIPSNIQFEPWLPQLDVLCHPNTKLFVTHGGLFGTQESVYCGVPCLGIPFFADQYLNLRTLESKHLATIVGYDDITKENILNAAKRLLEDSKYRTNAEIVSKMFKEQPVSALDTAIYWIDYVIRHNGAPHLRSLGADLPWYQYFLIDAGIILLTFLAIIIILGYYISRLTLRIVVYIF